MKIKELFSNARIRQLRLRLFLRKPRFLARVGFKYLERLFFSRKTSLRGVSLATSYSCNFNCSHCYARRFKRSNYSPLTLNEKIAMIKECLQMGAAAFDFVGGEISISGDFAALLPYTELQRTYISLASNGFLMTREKVKELKKMGIDKISISIDSSSEEEHDRFRNKKGSYKHCLEALENIQAEGLTPVIITTVSKEGTKKKAFKELVNFALQKKIQLVFSAAIPFGQWEGALDCLCLQSDLETMRELHKKHPSLTRDLYENLGEVGCPAVKQTLYISEYGDVMPCAFTHISFGNLKYESLRDIRNRALKIEAFSNYNPVCLPAEDREFITRHLSPIFTSKEYPITYKEAFKERTDLNNNTAFTRNIEKIDRACPLCGSRENKWVTAGREHEFDNTTHDLFCVVRCQQCHLVYLNPIPAPSTLGIIYPSHYYCHNISFTQESKNASPFLSMKRKLNKYFGYPRQIRKIIKHKSQKQGEVLQILDVGCGNGSALDIFRQEGGDRVRTTGLDYNKQALEITAAKGHHTIEGNIDTVHLPENSYDIVYSSNVIEHVAKPQQLLEKVYGALRPGGVFLCETPNFDSFDARWFGPRGYWGGFHFPRHWTFYTRETITKAAAKTGFSVNKVKYKPVPIFWIWSKHALLYRGKGEKEKADKKYPLIENKSNFLRSLYLKILFTFFDMVLMLVTGKTSLMTVQMKKQEKE